MTSPDGRGTSSSTPLIVAIGAVAVALMLVVGVAIGLYLSGGDDDPGTPTAAPGTTSASTAASSSGTSGSTSESRSSSSSSSSRSSSSPRPTTSGPSRTSEPRTNLGTGRDDVDSRGWIASRARCNGDDRALAVLATADGTRAAACTSADGRKYYRGDAGDRGSLEAPIIVDEGDRIVAQNGAWKYQMSPDGMLITENNEVKGNHPATVWGRG